MSILKKTAVLIIVGTLFISTSLIVSSTNAQESFNTPGPGSYKLLNQNLKPIIIPFKMHNGKPLMDVEINEKNATLMIDNGVLWDQVWLFGSPLIEELQLKPLEEYSIGGTGEGDPTQAYMSTNLKLRFKDIIFFEQPVLVSPPAAGFAEMFPGADGQLCNTFFKHFIVEFDFIKQVVKLHNSKNFIYEGDGSVLAMHQNKSGTYSIPFSFTLLDGSTFSDKVDIDFGGIYPLKIALNNMHNIKLPTDAKPAFSYGAQGKSTEYSGKIETMTVGKYTFKYPMVYFGDKKSSRIHPSNLGVIGLPLFMKFNIIFDYFSNQLYITPNKNYERPF